MPIPTPQPSAILSLVVSPAPFVGVGDGAGGFVDEPAAGEVTLTVVELLNVTVGLSSTCSVIGAVAQSWPLKADS